MVNPIFASALQFAFEKATTEGKMTICVLAIVSLFSWTVIITKLRQILRASKQSRKFYKSYRSTRTAMDLHNKKEEFSGCPAYEVYRTGIEELSYHLKQNPVKAKDKVRITEDSYDTIRVVLERAVSAQSMSLEKGMIVLSTAVAGGPFIGLLGTVWGVMDTFSGVARANAASLTAMAPGVAGALIATVIGLLVAIPAMFAYNFMVTSIRSITQEVDNFASEFSTQIEHQYVENHSLAEDIAAVMRRESAVAKDSQAWSEPMNGMWSEPAATPAS